MAYNNNSLRSQLAKLGINSSFLDTDPTEAQIAERDKTNPLGGFGFQSAQEQAQKDAQRQAYQQQLDQQSQAIFDQQVRQQSSQKQIGTYGGMGLMKLMQQIRGQTGDTQQAPKQYQNDPMIDRFTELAKEVGPSQAYIIAGQEALESGNQAGAGMIQKGQSLAQQAQEDKLKLANSSLTNEKLQTESDTANKKPNEVKTFDTMINGKPGKVQMEVIGKHPDGSNIYKEVASGLKGSVTGTPEQWGTSTAGREDRTKKFEGMLTSTNNVLDVYDKVDKLLDESPNSLGWAGKLISQADNLKSGIQNLGQTIAEAGGIEIKDSVNKPLKEYDWDSLSKVAGNSDKMKSLIFQLAYAQASSTDTARSISDKDIQAQIDIIGGSISNTKSFKSVMAQNKDLLIKKVDNLGFNTVIDGKPVSSGYSEQLKRLKARVPSDAADKTQSVDLGNGIRRRVK